MPRRFALVLLPLACVVLVTQAPAQTAAPPPPAKHKPDPYASPLATIMSSHLWTDVPPAQDFVRDSRPAPKALRYAPLIGQDPERPKPRDAANVMALQAELEQEGIRNAARARSLQPGSKAKHTKKRPE